jgi:hypothetical protein
LAHQLLLLSFPRPRARAAWSSHATHPAYPVRTRRPQAWTARSPPLRSWRHRTHRRRVTQSRRRYRPEHHPHPLLVASNYGGKLGVARTALFTRPLILDCGDALPSRCSSRHLPMHGSVSYERAPLWQRCTTRGSPSSTTQARRPMAVLTSRSSTLTVAASRGLRAPHAASRVPARAADPRRDRPSDHARERARRPARGTDRAGRPQRAGRRRPRLAERAAIEPPDRLASAVGALVSSVADPGRARRSEDDCGADSGHAGAVALAAIHRVLVAARVAGDAVAGRRLRYRDAA